MRRRRKAPLSFGAGQDPGKDLFAYLFLMVMIFSLLLLRTAEEQIADLSGSKSPQRIEQPGRSSLAEVAVDNLGHLGRSQGKLVLVFDGVSYHPLKDAGQLLADGRIALVSGDDGQEKKVLYLEDSQNDDILLIEYLEAFKLLNRQGIEVVFVDRVQ